MAAWEIKISLVLHHAFQHIFLKCSGGVKKKEKRNKRKNHVEFPACVQKRRKALALPDEHTWCRDILLWAAKPLYVGA